MQQNLTPYADYFLTSNSPFGFISYFNDTEVNDSWNKILIKGCPGSGKSKLMNKIIENISYLYNHMDVVRCSFNPNSLTAIILKDLKLLILNTGGLLNNFNLLNSVNYAKIISLDKYRNETAFSKNKNEILKLFNLSLVEYKSSLNFLKSFANITYNSYNINSSYLKVEKLKKFTNRLIKKEFKKQKYSQGIENKRFITTCCHQGIVALYGAFSFYEKIYVINDDYGVMSSIFFKYIKNFVINHGLKAITCYCPIFTNNKIDHLLIPQLKIAFITSNKYYKAITNPYKIINASRFVDLKNLKFEKKQLNFNKKITKELLSETQFLYKKYFSIFEKMESCYSSTIGITNLDEELNSILHYINNLK